MLHHICKKQKSRKIFQYKKAYISDLCKTVGKISEDFVKEDIISTTTESLWDQIIDHVDRVQLAVSNNIPSKMVSGNKPSPWINHKPKQKYQQKQRAFNAKKNNPSPDF